MGIDLKIHEMVEQAKAEGITASELRRRIRRRELEVELEAEAAAVEEVFNNPSRTPNWEEVKKFMRTPVHGEAQLGRTLADVENALRSDNEQEFYKAAFIGIRMIRRQAHPMGQELFGAQ